MYCLNKGSFALLKKQCDSIVSFINELGALKTKSGGGFPGKESGEGGRVLWKILLVINSDITVIGMIYKSHGLNRP